MVESALAYGNGNVVNELVTVTRDDGDAFGSQHGRCFFTHCDRHNNVGRGDTSGRPSLLVGEGMATTETNHIFMYGSRSIY